MSDTTGPVDAASVNRAELAALDVWQPCGRGICAAEAGHEGTCDEASGWAGDDWWMRLHEEADDRA